MTPQFNRKEVIKELLDKAPFENYLSVLTSLAEKTDKEIYELYKNFININI